MRFRKILPYLLFGSLVAIPKMTDEFHDIGISAHAKTIVTQPTPTQQELIQEKAKELCDTYIELVLQGQKNIQNRNNKKISHARAVLEELPGAPMGLYCIYGQYTQFNRALQRMGDTLNLIPYDARNACPRFKYEMRNKYNSPEYKGALHNGKMFKSDKAYNTALKAYLKNKNVTEQTSDSVRQAVIARFEKNNFSVESLHPGTILIVQWNDSPSNTHAVMFLGKGRVENGKFVSDSSGKYMYAGYNKESIDDVFKILNTDRIFAADMYEIACASYKQELNKIENLKNEDLFQYVYNAPMDMYAMIPSRHALQNMASKKYFYKNKQDFQPEPAMLRINMASMPLMPTFLSRFNNIKTK